MYQRHIVAALMVVAGAAAATTANAQSPAPAAPAAAPVNSKLAKWSFDVSFGFDNSFSGNINSSAIGVYNGQATVITKNQYEDVYGTGLIVRFGAGYKLDDVTELKATFTHQSADADLAQMGAIGSSLLYGKYDDYRYSGLDVGIRRFATLRPKVQAYGDVAIGVGVINETDVILVAPGANLAGTATDFYDQTAAFTISGDVGLLVETTKHIGLFGQVGLRWVSGMSAVDNLVGTGLESINDKSGRWTLPFLLGARFTF